MAARRKGKFILCTRQIPVNAGASYREPFIIECFKVNYRQDRITCRKEDEPKILEMLKLIVQHGVDVNVRGLRCSPRGMTAAMIAADQGLERCLRFLVESGADLTITADSGDNTLMMAARAGQVDCVKYLTEHSVSESSLNQVNKAGKTALLMAASSYQDDHGLSVKFLVEAGADVNVQDKTGRTALMLAVDRPPSYWKIGDNDFELHNTSRVQSLIKGEADLSLQDNKGRNALMIAIKSNQSIAILKLLTENMSVSTLNQVNKEGQTALMLAASNSDDVFFVKYLVEAGADLNLQDREGSNALMMAITLKRFNVAKYLTGNVFILALNQVTKEGQTALMLAASGSQDDHGLSVKCLVEAGADVNMQDRSGRTALMLAVERRPSYWTTGDNDTELHHTSRVQSLIKGEADLSLQDNKGRNALMIAIESNQPIAIIKLLTENMSVSTLNQVDKEGQTALMLAALYYSDDHGLSVKCLVEAGADVNVQDRAGSTALMYALEKDHTESVKFLTEQMSVPALNQVNNDGKTYLMMAASSSHDDHAVCVKCLVEAGADVNVQDRDGRTALMFAVDRRPSYWDIIRNNDFELHHTTRVQSLIKGEADLSLQDNKGRNALMIAIQSNKSIAILKLFTENMSVSTLNQVNNYGKTALMMAASGYADEYGLSVKCLVEAGADVNVHDRSGLTALMYALEEGHTESEKFLIEQMSVPALNQVNNDGKTALMMAASGYADEYGLSVKCLVEAGADVNLQDRYGRNALMIAIESNKSIAILKLLTENMSVSTLNQVDKEGKTALMMAPSSSDHKNFICLLIEAGADLNVTDTKKGYTALMCAIHKRNDRAATLLLEKGALVNTVSHHLKTPLSLIRSDKGMITELLSRGLDPALSCRDQGILHAMVAEGKDSVVRRLVMNGFPPVDIKCDVLTRRYNLYLPYLPQTTPMSPLALALTCVHHNIARYLIVNHFFTRYDSVHLCWNKKLRQSLQLQIPPFRQMTHVVQWNGDTVITLAKKCLDILDFLSARPLSLRDLCLVTISSALSQYLVCDPQDIPPGDSRWMCQPTFKKRVELLAIPPALKRQLLHQTSYSCRSCESWGDISLEEEM